jgi:hypothetical protein
MTCLNSQNTPAAKYEQCKKFKVKALSGKSASAIISQEMDASNASGEESK